MLHGIFNSKSLSLIRFLGVGILVLGIGTKGSIATSFEVEIEKPDACYKVSKIEENKVYLERKSNCVAPQVIVSEKVKLSTLYDVLKVYVDGHIWKEIPLKMISMEEVLKAVEEGEKKAKDLGNFSNVHEGPAKELAERIYQATQSSNFQALVKKYEEELSKQILGRESFSLKDIYKDYVGKKKAKERVLVLDPDERLYIFVSSSVPKETIRRYVTFVSSHIEGKAVFVLRGGIGGLKKLMPTVAWIYDVMKKEGNCEGVNCEVYGVEFMIDPFLFKRYEVKRVPAVVYAKGKMLTEFELSEGLQEKWESQVWGKTYGDMNLAYHLKVIAEELRVEKIKRFIDELNM
jgi:type-F conjugative transfer system pilin assembly protein TrbC